MPREVEVPKAACVQQMISISQYLVPSLSGEPAGVRLILQGQARRAVVWPVREEVTGPQLTEQKGTG